MRLEPFIRRIRALRALRLATWGALIGSIFAASWATIDAFGGWATTPLALTLCVSIPAVIGAVIGFTQRVRSRDVIASLDRRASLENRLETANEISDEHGFASALRSDAEARLRDLRPRDLYRTRMGRPQAAVILAIAATTAIFLLGNSPALMSAKAKEARDAMKAQAEKIKRLTKETLDEPERKHELTEDEKRLADELRKRQQELERAKMTPEEALRKQNELAQKAEDLKQKRDDAAKQDLKKAQTALEAWKKQELDKNGAKVDPKMGEMSEAERTQAEQKLKQQVEQSKAEEKAAQSKISDLQKRLDEINKKLANPNLSDAEHKALEAEKNQIEKDLADAKSALQKQQAISKELQEALKNVQLSKEAMDVFQKMANDPAFQELQKLAQKMMAKMQPNDQGEMQVPSKEEMEEMKRQLEELARQLKDPEAMKAYLDALREAIENMEIGQGMGMIAGGLGLGIPGMSGAGAPSQDIYTGDTGRVNHNDKPIANQGKTSATAVRGSRRETGPDTYVEIKAPTSLGMRTSVPYRQVLPSYKKKAESAMNRQEIPKEHERRVRAYFESLSK